MAQSVEGTLNWQVEVNGGNKLKKWVDAAKKKPHGGAGTRITSKNFLDILLAKAAQKIAPKIDEIVVKRLRIKAVNLARDIVDIAESSRTYTGFTGNTQTSYAVGIYQDGQLLQIICSGESMPPPVSPKVPRGELRVYKSDGSGNQKAVYEKQEVDRRVYGIANVNGMSGEETARRILQNWTFAGTPPKLAIVFTTGTEYSKYIEARKQTGSAEAFSYAYHHAKDLLK